MDALRASAADPFCERGLARATTLPAPRPRLAPPPSPARAPSAAAAVRRRGLDRGLRPGDNPPGMFAASIDRARLRASAHATSGAQNLRLRRSRQSLQVGRQHAHRQPPAASARRALAVVGKTLCGWKTLADAAERNTTLIDPSVPEGLLSSALAPPLRPVVRRRHIQVLDLPNCRIYPSSANALPAPPPPPSPDWLRALRRPRSVHHREPLLKRVLLAPPRERAQVARRATSRPRASPPRASAPPRAAASRSASDPAARAPPIEPPPAAARLEPRLLQGLR